jgi:hypothetical protein
MRLNAQISVSCTEPRLVRVLQEIWEKDTPQKGQYKLLASRAYNRDFRPAGGGSTVIDSIKGVPDNHPGLDNEQIYQKVTFRVCTYDICSPYTPREASATTTFHN